MDTVDTILINGVSCDVVEHEGKRYVKKPAGGTGGGQTSFALELLGDVPAAAPPSPPAPAEASISVPAADAKAIEDAVAKAEADAASHTS